MLRHLKSLHLDRMLLPAKVRPGCLHSAAQRGTDQSSLKFESRIVPRQHPVRCQQACKVSTYANRQALQDAKCLAAVVTSVLGKLGKAAGHQVGPGAD
jgi:hypothetical protein